MIKLENFVGTEKQQAVLNKHGWLNVENMINRAWIAYWNVIRSSVGATCSYSSVIDICLTIQSNLIEAVIDYLYKNDNQLCEQFGEPNKDNN